MPKSVNKCNTNYFNINLYYMELSQNQYNMLFLVIISFILFVILFKWIDYLTNENYIVECFTNGVTQEKYDGSTEGSFASTEGSFASTEGSFASTTHTVDLPLTTSYSCKNFCGPPARCSITGQQCFADIDCPGCQPYSPPLPKAKGFVPGDNDAGKLTVGVTPQYSPLTSGYGTKELQITSNMYSKPAQANFGVDVWSQEFDEDKKLFDQRYKPSGLQYMPDYPKRYSLTGEFIEDGPYASNAPIPTN
jgi:hypothetical protein